MHRLTKGANAFLTAETLSIEVEWEAGVVPADLDVSALLLDDRGRVGDDEDFVFFNAPRHRSGAVVLGPGGREGRRSLAVDLGGLPAAVQVVAVVLSSDGAAIGDGHRVVCTALDGATGDALAQYPLSGTSSETAVLLAELYRRDGRWKIRAVGQGWDSGLAALATEYGVVVDEPVEAPPGSATPPPPAPAPAGPEPRTTELTRGGTAAIPGSGPIELTLSWEVARAGRLVPLDADAVVTDRRGGVIGAVGTRRADPVPGVEVRPGGPTHHAFVLRPAELPAEAAAIACTLTSFGGQRFTEIARSGFDLSAAGSTVRATFTGRERRTGVLLLRLERSDPGWRAVAVGEHGDARRGVELVQHR